MNCRQCPYYYADEKYEDCPTCKWLPRCGEPMPCGEDDEEEEIEEVEEYEIEEI